MATVQKKKKLALKTVFYGLLTAVLYAAVFSNTDMVMQLFTRGGAYAALPLATVFVFSFAHGTFSGNLWSVLGIDAVYKQPVKRTEIRPARPVQTQRPRLRMSA